MGRDSQPLLETPLTCVDIAVPLPISGLFTYTIPKELEDRVKIGVRVRVTFRNREMIGYLVASSSGQPTAKLKPLLEILDDEPVLSSQILNLTRWISEYYGSSWGEAIENALPKWVKYGKKAERALKRQKEELQTKNASNGEAEAFELSKDQTAAYSVIKERLEKGNAKPILLFGVTGSGKSELYIRAIRQVLKEGKSAICLVPEIALTEQIRRFFFQHFGPELEILHSKLSDGERFLAWKRLEAQQKRVVLGPRSAIFAPLPKLGLIIIDEEHENTYKQETTPRYHAREVAAYRAKEENALLIMGTATPSMESTYLAQKGEYELLELKTRIDSRPMPVVEILDLKYAPRIKKGPLILTHKLASEIEQCLAKKEGVMLLLNRRGYSTSINCPKCGFVESCKSCQVSLTFHQEDRTLLCHYCNFQKKVPELCEQCNQPVLRFAGFGTEKVENEVAARFPMARIARMDADSIRKKGSHEVILKQFRKKEVDILIGTQMIAKGFDFQHVTLVGVIFADVGLSLPDFRSSERTFQLLTQVAGRAGRGNKLGRVYVQTFSPSHPSIRCAKGHDYQSFFEHELKERYQYQYPPYKRLINIIIRSKTEASAYQFARSLREALKPFLAAEDVPEEEKDQIIGPAPLPFYKLRGHFRWHVMLKLKRGHNITSEMKLALSKVKKPSGVAFVIDVDPLNIL